MMSDMKLPEGYTCGDCANWRKCTALIESIEPTSTECDFSPSRFAVSMNQLAKARAAKEAIRAEYMDLLAMYEKDTDALRAEVARLREALEWYANPKTYRNGVCGEDRMLLETEPCVHYWRADNGMIARLALEAK